ncbi:MAG: OsmC family peroxiredoxin, partial [Lactobacillales bacterium]|nr:OsmC family peroxiredoxin [Lactobacillales bacterium]
MNKDALFHTKVVNDAALEGEAYVVDGLRVLISDPLSNEPGSNPEELFGLAWSTCLNATIQALLKGRGLDAKSRVEVDVSFK